MINFVIVDETGKVVGQDSDLGNVLELHMVLEEILGKKLRVEKETLEMV